MGAVHHYTAKIYIYRILTVYIRACERSVSGAAKTQVERNVAERERSKGAGADQICRRWVSVGEKVYNTIAH